jgi:hypothetical protein
LKPRAIYRNPSNRELSVIGLKLQKNDFKNEF